MPFEILFRKDRDNEEEFEIAKQVWQQNLYEYRTQLPQYSIVIGRYSVLPFYKDLEKELTWNKSRLINSYKQHEYIADIMQWYEDIKQYTPKTYTTWDNLHEGKWVVKGKTNSRKFQWNKMMFADGRYELLGVIERLFHDSLISSQGVVVRDYVPLKTVGEGINGLPITREWRCFFYGEDLIASGYYWASHPECDQGELPKDGLDFVKEVAKIISKKTTFFVLDVAEKEEGGWIIIEVNDGQMSGLSNIDPHTFYTELFKHTAGVLY